MGLSLSAAKSNVADTKKERSSPRFPDAFKGVDEHDIGVAGHGHADHDSALALRARVRAPGQPVGRLQLGFAMWAIEHEAIKHDGLRTGKVVRLLKRRDLL
jgi:hypothetical protein